MLSDKIFIVAGGGHGIGESVAVELGELGATVVVNDLGTTPDGESKDQKPAKETVETILNNGGVASSHFGDVSSLDYTEDLVEDTIAEYGRIDGVVNFAGILRDSISWKMTAEEWDAVLRVHLRGHFALFRNVAKHWRGVAREQDGHLQSQRSFLAVSSRSAFGRVGQLNYSAAKAGVLGFTRTAARELARFNVRVNALVPSAHTRLTETISEEELQARDARPTPQKVVPAAVYLLSDGAEDITGCTVRAAGDMVGLISDPTLDRVAFQNGGWTVDDLADRFPNLMAGHGIDDLSEDDKNA